MSLYDQILSSRALLRAACLGDHGGLEKQGPCMKTFTYDDPEQGTYINTDKKLYLWLF